jgi:hypothetical protein
MIDARFAIENIGRHMPLWSELAPRFFKSKKGSSIMHLCYPSMAYERVTQVPPRNVAGLFNRVIDNDDGRLACQHCGVCLPKSIAMAVRLGGLSI